MLLHNPDNVKIEMPMDEEVRSQPRTRSASNRLPGTWQAALIAALTAMGVGYWAQAREDSPGASAANSVSRVAEVAPQDVPAALDTIAGTQEQLARYQSREACGARLAWVTVMRSSGQPAGRIRLQSGNYISPAFDLADTPVRVALPYPAPYATGRGTISVIGTTTDAIVALTPPWHIPAQGGVHAQQ